MEFRSLYASEIDCRIATVKENGLSLLLYKDARCDMNILDETVGCFNWKREHTRDNANCIVSLWDEDKKQWIGKEDTGAESYTEKEKGLASDSFKRACFNWGIGRELYTAPFIWVNAKDCNIKGTKCYDKFKVATIGYNANKQINEVKIINAKTKAIVFELTAKQEEVKKEKIKKSDLQVLEEMIVDAKVTPETIKSTYAVLEFDEMTYEQYDSCLHKLQLTIDKNAKVK